MARKCKGKPVPTDKALYGRVKAAAKRKFPTYPSIYANSWLVQEYKRRGGTYACTSRPTRGGLTRWYKEKWVDLSRPLSGGGYASCGRPSVDPAHWREAYPKCRPLAEAKKMTPSQVRSAVRRKRRAVKGSKRGKPKYVRTYSKNAKGLSWGAVLLGAIAAAYITRKLIQQPIDRARGVASP